MVAPGGQTLTTLTALCKQALGGRAAGQLDATWYTARLNSGYSRLTTFQGMVMAPGMRRPRFRALRFHELYYDDDRVIGQDDVQTSNFIVPVTTRPIVYVDNVYDLTNEKQLKRKSIRFFNARNPNEPGIPNEWSPAGGDSGAVGYFIRPIPSSAAQEIRVRERTYQYPEALSATQNPVIPNAWHAAIWMAAAAEGARLIDWPEKAAEMEQMFMSFISERRSPVEEAGAAGGRRHFTVGGRI